MLNVAPARKRRRTPRPSTLDLRPNGPLLEVLGQLGEGGMGTVWRVREVTTGRVLALKQLLPNRISTRALRRFLRECQVSGSLRHPGIVRVHSAGSQNGRPWLLTELIEGGRTLRTIVDDPETTRAQRLRLLLEVGRAVGCAHRKGVIHRDLKPDNVLVSPEGHARLTDFGLAKVDDGNRLTRTGSMVGTPHYMAPEQITGETSRQGPATDVWALGVMLYQSLAGRLPFECDNLSALSARVCKTQQLPLGKLDPTITPALQAVCARALHKQPERRYGDGDAFADALEAALRDPQQSTPPPRWLLPLVAALAAFALLAMVLCALRSPEPAPIAEVEFAALPARTTSDSLDLSGSASVGEGWVEVSVAGTVRQVPLRAGAFTCSGLPLVPGENQVRARVLPEGTVAQLVIERLVAPAWYWQQRARPSFPLPGGIVFGDTPGDYVNTTDGSVLRWIPAGSYAVGEESTIEPRSAPRTVKSAGFFAGKLEVTWAQFAKFCEATGRDLPLRTLSSTNNGMGSLDPSIRKGPRFDATDLHPVYRVTYHDAVAYCEWAGLRLPSGEEWEIAARGRNGTRFPWGNRPHPKRANTEVKRDGHFYPSPVGAFPEGVSPFGCLDMAGNVSEWTSDYFPGQTTCRVVRGGSWNMSFDFCEATLLEPQNPRSVMRSVGLRVFR